MLALNLPKYSFKIQDLGDKKVIFDPIRKKYIALTPEEWVRQNFVRYLIEEKLFPINLIANEISLKLHQTTKRCDSIIYDRGLSPIVIVEYKAPDVEITQKVFDQISRYNVVFKVPYLIITNGLSHFCCHVDYLQQSVTFLKEIPNFQDII